MKTLTGKYSAPESGISNGREALSGLHNSGAFNFDEMKKKGKTSESIPVCAKGMSGENLQKNIKEKALLEIEIEKSIREQITNRKLKRGKQ